MMRRLILISLLAVIPHAAGVQDADPASTPPDATTDAATDARGHSPVTTPASDSTNSESSDPAASKRARVIVQVKRSQEVAGYVELEDDLVLVIRRLNGELQSYVKSEVGRILRLVDPKPGQRGHVLLRNGSRTAGVITRDGFREVTVEVEGVAITFRRDTVERVILNPGFDEQYENYLKTITNSTPQRHLTLCVWLKNNKRYDLSLMQLNKLIKTHPDLTEAHKLRRIINAQLALQKPADKSDPTTSRESEPDAQKPEKTSGAVSMKDLLPDTLVSARDVNLIRVFEIDFNHPPKLAVPADTIRTLLEQYGSSHLIPSAAADRTAMFRADPVNLVRVMFELQTRELYDQIKVISEPRALNLFRQRVHNTWLINNCSTSRCHGGPYAGRFFLHRKNSRNERVRYTNLLILDRLELDPEWPLINYEAPADSLIIQHGLPRELARKPHPPVRGWKPVFTKNNRRLHRLALEWIESMMRPRPDYPVEYEPPMLGTHNSESPAPGSAVQADDSDERTPR